MFRNNTVIKEEHIKRIKGIHQLSAKYNKLVGKDHNDRLLELVDKHAIEIRQLHGAGDKHFLVETGDLLILCLELIIENGGDIDEISLKCFERYENKLKELIDAEQ